MMNSDKAKAKRLIVMIAGLVIMGLGIATFKVSMMGNDPHTAMVMSMGNRLGVDFSMVLIVVNSIWFVAEILFGRRYIGVGTFANWFGVGSLASLWISLINRCLTVPDGLLPKLSVMFVGVLILSLGASMYQTSDLGIAPYDVISIILSERLPVPYFWCRVFTDSFCALSAFVLGGLVGLGTLVCALGLGPFIVFFNHHVSEKICD